MALTPAQLAERRQGITATDMAAIVHLHPNRSVLDVAEDKRGLKELDDLGPRVKWGNLLEAPIRDDYAERHDVRVTVPGTLTHPKVAHHKATPDGLVWYRAQPEADRGLEIKTHTVWLRGGYGTPGTDEVPLHELVQCAWNMHVTGLARWDLVAFIDGLPTDYVIERDQDLIDDLVVSADRFWTDVVVGGATPDPDGTDRYEQHLKAKFQERAGAGFREADAEIVASIGALRDARAELDKFEADKKRLEQTIKAYIQHHEGVEFPALGGRGQTERITYRKSVDGINVDHAAMVAEVASTLALARSSGSLALFSEILGAWPDGFALEGGGKMVTAGALRDAVKAVVGLDLAAIEKTHSTPRIGPRVFNCPRAWKGSK